MAFAVKIYSPCPVLVKTSFANTTSLLIVASAAALTDSKSAVTLLGCSVIDGTAEELTAVGGPCLTAGGRELRTFGAAVRLGRITASTGTSGSSGSTGGFMSPAPKLDTAISPVIVYLL